MLHSLDATLRSTLGLASTHNVRVVVEAAGDAGVPACREDASGEKTPEGGAEAWIALTDASPQSSCVYAIPAPADPRFHRRGPPPAGVGGMGADGSNAEDLPALVASAHQHVRALSATRGDVLLLADRLVRWTSAHAGRKDSAPFVALATGFAGKGGDGASLLVAAERHLAVPTLDARLALISTSLLAAHATSAVPLRLFPAVLATLVRTSHLLSDAALDGGARIGARVQRALAALRLELTADNECVSAEAATLPLWLRAEQAEAIRLLAGELKAKRGLAIVAELAAVTLPALAPAPMPVAAPPQPLAAPPPPVAAVTPEEPRVVDVTEATTAPLPPAKQPKPSVAATGPDDVEPSRYEEVD